MISSNAPEFQEVTVPPGQDGTGKAGLTVRVYVISDTQGNILIATGAPGVKQGTKKPSSNRIASDYLDRVFMEVFAGRDAGGRE